MNNPGRGTKKITFIQKVQKRCTERTSRMTKHFVTQNSNRPQHCCLYGYCYVYFHLIITLFETTSSLIVQSNLF